MQTTPTPLSERINELDVIRGFALFGIFLVNMPGYLQPELFLSTQRIPEHASAADFWLRMMFDMFVQTKFYTIFSFLFGAGFYLFMSRLEQRGVAVGGKYFRRLFALFLFGAVHLVFWFGDILHTYALAGILLYLFYRSREVVIKRWAITLLAIYQIPMGLALLVPDDGQNTGAQKEQVVSQAIDAYQNGSWEEWLSFRWNNELPVLVQNEWLMVLTVLPLFLLGLYVAKKGVFYELGRYEATIRRYWMGSLLIGFPLAAMIPLVHFGIVPIPGSLDITRLVLVQWSGLALFVFYLTSILLVMRKERGRERLSFLAPVGRMALTNYLSQTVLCVSIVKLFHLYGSTPLWAGFVLCLFIFPVQVAWSKWWLSRYRYGPLEWVWRCLTYGAVQQLKK
ncbi:DUF418 domain-containing protein [Brevibacillus borstelensis]|uniref:DUF418 domain-containing protein n=1 Tax=Brevibacillus borstelensis TaxID=45462 RepID=UPI0030BEF63D